MKRSFAKRIFDWLNGNERNAAFSWMMDMHSAVEAVWFLPPASYLPKEEVIMADEDWILSMRDMLQLLRQHAPTDNEDKNMMRRVTVAVMHEWLRDHKWGVEPDGSNAA